MKATTFSTSGSMSESINDFLLRPANLDFYLRELPVSIVVLPRLQGLLLSDDADATQVAELIRTDPGLATKVMAAAQSAYYGQSRQIDSIDAALALLGFREAYRITATFAMSKYLNTPLRVYGMGPWEYWRQSVATALVMERRAPEAGLDECVAYTVGLLHALGMMFVDRHLRSVGDVGMLLRESTGSPLPRQEARLIGMTQAQVAAFVLRKWDFSEGIVMPILQQFEPARATMHREMTQLLADSRVQAAEIVRTLPAPGRAGQLPEASTDENASIALRILALEIWAR